MSDPTTWRITPGPGNSITVGNHTPDKNGWRGLLHDGLVTAGVDHTFVGRVEGDGNGGGLAISPYHVHEGFGSHYMAADAPEGLSLIRDRVPGMDEAEIYIIDAFTVDVANGRTLAQMQADAEALWRAALAKATWGIVVCKSLPFGTISGISNTNMVAINAATDAIVEELRDEGYRVTVADQYTGADMETWSSDGVHITETAGQEFMAANVLAAVLELIAMAGAEAREGLPLQVAFPLGGSGTSALGRTDAFYQDVIGWLPSAHVWASYDGGEDWEPLIIGGELDERMSMGGSSRKLLDVDDNRFIMRRAGGWPSASVLIDEYVAERGTGLSGQVGPAVAITPADGEELARADEIVVSVTVVDNPIVEESIGVWLSFDGGARWEAAVKKGELVSIYSEAGSVKAANGGGGWDFTLTRIGALYSARRDRRLVVKALCNDDEGIMDGETVA